MSKKTDLSSLRRPKLLIRAARAGMLEYRRSRDLKRIAGIPANVQDGRIVDTLLREENRMEDGRKSGDAAYSIRKHISVMTALLAETNAQSHHKMAA